MFIKFTKYIKIPLVLLGITFLSFLLTNYHKEVHFETFFFGAQNKSIEQNNKARIAKISEIIQNATQNQPGRYSIYVKDLKTGEEFEIASSETFSTASIYKLAVMYKAYDEINQGNLDKDDVISDEKIVLDRLIAGQNEPEEDTPVTETSEIVSLDVKHALDSMITISDNYSALLLANRLGWKNINDFLKEKNIEDFDVLSENPTTTAKSVGTLLEQIYNNTAVNTKYSEEMRSLLFAQKINDRIPKYLPSTVKVGHKTGELETLRHDAGIILGENSHYIFVFLTDTPNQSAAAENLANLSKSLYDALENSF